MFHDVEAVIFDIDGTLLNSMTVWSDIDDIFLEKYHLTEPEDFHEGMEGMSYSETAEYFLRIFPTITQTSEELQQEWYDMAYEIYATEVTMKKGAYEFLKTLKEQGYKLGVATSNHRDLAICALNAHGISEWFDSIWTSGEAGAGKPAPDVYLKVAESLQVAPEHCLVFEDVPMGILAGKNAGMKVCAVEDHFSRNQLEKKKAYADYYIVDYDDIQKQTYEVLK